MRLVSEKHSARIWAVGIAVTAIVVAGAMSGSCAFDSNTTFCEQYGLRCREGQQCATNEPKCIEIGGCGDGNTDKNKGEICDDGNNVDGDGCSADCKSNETCGNGITDMAVGEVCDDHNTNAGDGCGSDCKVESHVCGNTIIEKDIFEICDDGNKTPGDGCSPNCTSNEACGNKIIDNYGPDGPLHEDCDPENLFPLSAKDTFMCDSDCTFPACGDGHTNPLYLVPDSGSGHLEECDRGLMSTPTDSPGCDADCTFVKCGDGHMNQAAGEDCDLGSTDDTPTCDNDCTTPMCGDGHINPTFKPNGANAPPEVCDTGGDTLMCDSDCTLPACGDGHTNMQHLVPDSQSGHPERCDDGSIRNGVPTPVNSATCDDDCTNAICGDGHINAAANETCEDGNHNNNDDCPDNNGTCRDAACGDGFIWNTQGGNEQCDNGAANDDTQPDACRTDCVKAFCGDGVKDSNEACDKGGNGKPETGCSANTTCNGSCMACQ